MIQLNLSNYSYVKVYNNIREVVETNSRNIELQHEYDPEDVVLPTMIFNCIFDSIQPSGKYDKYQSATININVMDINMPDCGDMLSEIRGLINSNLSTLNQNGLSFNDISQSSIEPYEIGDKTVYTGQLTYIFHINIK